MVLKKQIESVDSADLQLPQEGNEFIWTSSPFPKQTPSLNLKIQEMEQSTLQCPICHELFRNAVSLLPCLHSFCSECIRISLKNGMKGMKRRRECPQCRMKIQETDQKAIIMNRGLQETVEKYRQLRCELWISLAKLNSIGETESPTKNKIVSKEWKEGDNPGETKRGRSKRNVEIQNKEQNFDVKRPRRSTRNQIDSDVSLSESGNGQMYDHDEIVEEGTVICKEEAQYMPQQNARLNSLPSLQQERRHPRATPHYHLLNRKKLQNLCIAEGLLSYGNENDLKIRHQEFITLWNAECDSVNPRSKAELLAEFAKRNHAKTGEHIQSLHKGILMQDRCLRRIKESRKVLGNLDKDNNTGDSSSKVKVSSGDVKFDNTFNKGFKDLIKNAHERGIVRKMGKLRTLDEIEAGSLKRNPATVLANKGDTETSMPLIPGILSNSSISVGMQPSAIVKPQSNLTCDNEKNSVILNTAKKGPYSEIVHINSPSTNAAHCSSLTANLSTPVTQQIPPRMTNPYANSKLSPHCQTSLVKNPYKSIRVEYSPSSHSSSTSPVATIVNTRISLDTSKDITPIDSSLIGKWKCERCTYLNLNRLWSSAKCELCNTRRPSSRSGSASKIEHV